MEMLGADPSARTQPPHIRSQLSSLEKEQKARATRFTRDVIDRALVDLLSVYRDALVVRTGAGSALVNEDSRQVVQRVSELLGPDELLARDGRHRHGPRADRRQRQPAARARGDGPRPAAAPLRRPITCRFVTWPASDGRPDARLSCAHEASPRRRPRGGHGHRPRACPGARSLDGIARLGQHPVGVGHPAEPAPRVGGAVALLHPAARLGRLRGGAVRDPRGARRLRQPAGRHHRAGPGQGAGAQGGQAARVARRQPRWARAASGVDYARAADFIVGKGVRERLRRRRLRPARRRSLRAHRLPHRPPSSTPSSAPTRPPTTPPRSRPSRRPRAGLRRRPAAPTPGRCSRTCRPRTPPRTWTCCAPPCGEEKLTYLGKSYGTYLGTVYAGLFPTNVGRMVLDGVVAPDLTPEELNLGQAKGFELATRQWAAYCVERGRLPAR